MTQAKEALAEMLRGLTDFQRATVNAGMAQLQQQASARLLVADEVGLGKTVVARGLIAHLVLERLEAGVKTPLRVVYVCSNQALAQENVQKLAVFKRDDAKRWMRSPSFSRLAELGLASSEDAGGAHLLEICSLTPGTSLALNQGHGNAMERYIVWRALLQDRYISNPTPLEAFFSKDVQSWQHVDYQVRRNNLQLVDGSLRRFLSALSGEAVLPKKLRAPLKDTDLNLRSWRTLLEDAVRLHGHASLTRSQADLISFVRGKVRALFVESCVDNLQADLFILDEFQRFKELLDPEPDDDTTQREDHAIARKVLHREGDHHTLLLSATPFKALTHVGEDETESAHAAELQKLFGYLTRCDDGFFERYETLREKMLDQLLHLPPGPIAPGSLDDAAKRQLQGELRQIMFRTERDQLLGDERGTLKETSRRGVLPTAQEIREYVALDRLGETLKTASEQPVGIDMMQLFKNAPWCLSFSGPYRVRELLQDYRRAGQVPAALAASRSAWIPADALDRYAVDLTDDPPSAKFRELLFAALPRGTEQLLWVPPSVPYYQPEGAFARWPEFSKTLLFSGLVIAPRALSSLVSYECERRLLAASRNTRQRYFGDRSQKHGPLAFESNSVSAAFGLAYPSERLAGLIEFNPKESLDRLRSRARQSLKKDFDKLVRTHGNGATKRGVRWYVLAPLLLDTGETRQSWFAEIRKSKDITEARKNDARQVHDWLSKPPDLGQPPADLLDYLVDLAIAGPAVCALRSLRSVLPTAEPEFASMATTCALAFLGRMNRWESQRAFQAVCGKGKPWITLLQYSAQGNLQATFDEYFHLLHGQSSSQEQLLESFVQALEAGASAVVAQSHLPYKSGDRRKFDHSFHCHVAVPLGNQNITDQKGVSRVVNVRAAFNSPFWPFLLNSTSVGQEGLDFHWYSRRVVHWSLPSNPIDIEQREGRVNRYKSLLVRQRLAQALDAPSKIAYPHDVWSNLFRQAASNRTSGTDLEPLWYVHGETPKLERLVPAVSFSAEQSRLPQLLRVLSLYRLCVGQPRQEELLASLLKQEYSAADLREIKRALIVELAPILQEAPPAMPSPIVVRPSERAPPIPPRRRPGEPDPHAPPPPG